jgi:predicted dehydrogenase
MVGTIRTAVVGCGYWGPKLIRNFHELPEARLTWVCDLWQERLDHVKELYPYVQTTHNYREVLGSDVDAVVIATPVHTHSRLALEALRAGKHVLVEKPMTSGSDEAEMLVYEAERRGLVVMVGHTFEYNPAVEAVREIIASGQLGEIYYINAVRVNLGLFQPDINVLWDLAPHDVSILMFILGQVPESTRAHGGMYVQPHRGLHDVAYVTLNFPSGVMASIQISWLDPCKIRRYTVVGSEKMLVYDDIEPKDKVMIYDKGVDRPPFSDTEAEFHLSYRHGDAVAYPIRWVEPLREECRDFVECIQTGRQPRSSGEVGLKVVRVLEAAQRSLLNGGTQEEIQWQKWTMPVLLPTSG